MAEVGGDLRKGEATSAEDLRDVQLPRGSARFGWFLGVLLLGVLLAVATHWSEQEELARLLRESEPLWLVAAALLQLLTYVCAAGVWQRALAWSDGGPRLAALVPLGLAKLFTDQALPSIGVSGTLVVVRGLERRGVQRTAAVAAMLTGLVAYYLAYFAATLATVAIVWHGGELRLAILLPVALLCLFSAGVPLVLFALRRQMLRSAPHWLQRWPVAREVSAALRDAPPGSLFAPGLLLETALLQLAIFALDAATLDLALRAVATPAGFSAVFASFVVASAVSSLAWVPGGLGTFEAACIAMLHLHGVSIEGALAATLLLRGMTFWLPMLPGFAMVRRETGARR